MFDSQSVPVPTYSVNAFGIGEMIRKLLFERAIDNRGAKLADNGTIIGDWIGNNPDIDMSHSSARTSISQLTMGKRAASDELRKGLMLYVAHVLDEKKQEAPVKNRLAAELAFHLDRLQTQISDDDLGEFSSDRLFYKASHTAKMRVALPPGYLPTGSDGRLDPERETLRFRAAKILLDHVAENNGRSGNQSQYVMCFREKKFAGELWRNLFRQLIATHAERETRANSSRMCEDVLDRLEMLCNTDVIMSYVLHEGHYTLPFVCLDPDETDAIAYSVLHDGEAIITTFVPPAFVQELRKYCVGLYKHEQGGDRVRFNEFREFLRLYFEYSG